MPPIPLPEDASLEHLRSQAKLVRQLFTQRDDGALDLVDEFHPRVDDARSLTDDDFKLADAQLVVARLYGLPSWPELRSHLGEIDVVARPDTADRRWSDAADVFVAHAVVSYGDDDAHARLEAGRRMLDADPSLAAANIASIATVGVVEALARAIDEDPTVVATPCGPNEWAPLLYCAYSRIEPDGDGRSTLDCARLLLDAGADPDAGFLWRGLVPPFTALTGAFGRGEQDQPRHPEAFALGRLLLNAGADPNDGQALYDNGLAGSPIDDTRHLELLVEYGLGTDRGGPWYRRFGRRLTAPEELLYDELEVAALRNLPRRARFLAGLGLDLTRPVGRTRRPPIDIAREHGNDEVATIFYAARR